jgi:integrase
MTSKTVPKITLFDRAGIHYYRVIVPKDLHEVIRKKRLVGSTKTSDKRKAELFAARRHTEILEEFEAAERKLNPQPVAEITAELGKVLAERARAQVLRLDDLTRHDPKKAGALYAALGYQLLKGYSVTRTPVPLPTDLIPSADHPDFAGAPYAQAQTIAALHTRSLADLRVAAARGDLLAAMPYAKQEAEALGLVIDWHNKAQAPQIGQVLRLVLAAIVKAHEDLEARNQGRMIETPAIEAKAPALKARKLRDVFDKWKASKKRSPDADRACERALVLFETWAKNPDLEAITRQMGSDFRAHLTSLDGTSKTARDRFVWAQSLLKFAAQDLEWLDRQPWRGLSIESKTTNKRRPWTAAELQKFFSQPLFTSYALPSLAKAGKDAAYWVPLLGLFTGARIGELCQLHTQDVDTVGAVLHIRDEAEGQQLKTANAERAVPIHPELIRLGFLEFAQRQQANKPGPLWDALPLRKDKPGGYFSQWFNEARKVPAVGLADGPDFHCLRHTVRTKMTESGISEAIQDRITGHALTGSTGTKVYAHPVDILRTAVASIQYPGLSLPRAYASTTK